MNLEMQFLLMSDREGDGRKTLVAFSFPDYHCPLEDRASSSGISWLATRGNALCKDISTHQGWASWSGVATWGALVNCWTDPDGLCIHMRLQCGRVYGVLSEGSSPSEQHEGIVLEPNARLYDRAHSHCILADSVIL